MRSGRFDDLVASAFIGAAALLACEAFAAGDLADVRGLDQLSLPAADQLLQRHSRELRAAQRAVDAARAGVLSAEARQNPNFTVQTSNINPQVGIGPGSLRDKAFDTQIRLDYVIERGQKRDLRIAAANDLERASDEDLRESLRSQRLQLANAYYDLLLAQERVRLAQATSALSAETLAASKRRLAAGDVAASDVDRISVEALRSLGDERLGLADRQRAQFTLAAILGLEAYAERIVATDPWPGPLEQQSSENADELIENRPDVRAAKARVGAAQYARELARSQRIRDVAVAATYDHWPTNGSNQQGTGNSYGFLISVPLFLGNHFDGEIAKAEVEWGSAQDALEKVTAAARAELGRNRMEIETARDRLARYDRELLLAASRVADAQEFAYRRGAIGLLDLLDARRTLHALQLDAEAARADYATAAIAWRQAWAMNPLE